ncbi:MAG: M28 family peptidase [Thermoanaerobaculia bacterium]
MRGRRLPGRGRRLRAARTAILAAAWLSAAAALRAQSSPFLDEGLARLLIDELSGEMAYDNMRITTQWHKLSGSSDFFATARYVMEKAKAYGLEDVRWIDQKGEQPYWEALRGEAWIREGEGPKARERKIGSYAGVETSVADFSRPADVTADLVDVGSGETGADYRNVNVRGKIVLASGALAAVTEQAVWKRGAAGILSYNSSRLNPLADAPDQVAWLRVPVKDGPRGEKTTFAFVLSAREGQELSEKLRGQATRRIFAEGSRDAVRLQARVVVESRFLPDGKTAMVEGRIRGTDPSLPEVVLTAHLQESKPSANDDQSGVASVLEIGRALTRLIREGKLPRPRRGIRFWWADEIYSEYRYFADHPEEARKVLMNLNQDMVGARQSVGGRVQYMVRPPWSRPSFLPDVQESILEAVVAGNSGFLAAWQAQSPPPGVGFSRPIFARLGSREPFHARAIPYHGNTDHLVFNDAWVGAPGTSLTNWPDEFIHSSDDDLWQIDRTQLKRNAFVVAAAAWWIATADAAAVPALASFVTARGLERLGRDLATALSGASGPDAQRASAYRAAANLLAVSLEKEKSALASTRQIAPLAAGPSREPDELLRDRTAVLDQAAREMQSMLYAAYGSPPPVRPAETWGDPVLERLAQKTPRKAVATLADWMDLQRKVRDRRELDAIAKRAEKDRAEESARKAGRKPPAPAADPPALSPILQFEVLNWADGTANAAEIARRVHAEALSAGHWYYGDAAPATVEKFLETQVKDGLLVW